MSTTTTSLAAKIAARDARIKCASSSDVAGWIESQLDAWPPLTDQQRTALWELLEPVRLQPNRPGGTGKRKKGDRTPP